MSNKQTLFSILIFIVALSLLYFIFWDSFIETKQTFASLREEQQELESLKALIANSAAFSKKLNAISADIPFLFEALPSLFSESDYITKLSSIASESGMVLTKIDISQPDSTGSVSANIALSGGINSLERLLKNLETSLPLFDFSATGLKSSKEEQFDARFQGHILPNQANKNMSYGELKEKLDGALSMNIDILKDSRIKLFKKPSSAPSPSPADMFGRDDPFAPL